MKKLLFLWFLIPTLSFAQVKLQSITDLSNWSAKEHVYVQGSIPVAAEDLKNLNTWLSTNAPNWTVVISETTPAPYYSHAAAKQISGTETMPWAVADFVTAKPAFSELTNKLNERSGVVFTLILSERALGLLTEDAFDKRGIGEKMDKSTLYEPAKKYLRSGNIVGAVKEMVTVTQGRLETSIRNEEITAANQALAKKEALERTKTEHAEAVAKYSKLQQDFKTKYKDAVGDLVQPLSTSIINPVNPTPQNTTVITAKIATLTNALAFNGTAYLPKEQAVKNGIDDLAKATDMSKAKSDFTQLINLRLQATSELEAGLSVYASTLEKYNAGYRPLMDQLSNTTTHLKNAALFKLIQVIVAALAVLVLLVVYISKLRKKLGELRATYTNWNEAVTVKNDALLALEDGFRAIPFALKPESKYTGKMLTALNTTYHNLGELFILLGSLHKVLKDVRPFIQPSGLQHITLGLNYWKVSAALEKLTNTPLKFDNNADVTSILRGNATATELLTGNLTSYKSFEITFEELIERFNAIALKCSSVIDDLKSGLQEHALTTDLQTKNVALIRSLKDYINGNSLPINYSNIEVALNTLPNESDILAYSSKVKELNQLVKQLVELVTSFQVLDQTMAKLNSTSSVKPIWLNNAWTDVKEKYLTAEQFTNPKNVQPTLEEFKARVDLFTAIEGKLKTTSKDLNTLTCKVNEANSTDKSTSDELQQYNRLKASVSSSLSAATDALSSTDPLQLDKASFDQKQDVLDFVNLANLFVFVAGNLGTNTTTWLEAFESNELANLKSQNSSVSKDLHSSFTEDSIKESAVLELTVNKSVATIEEQIQAIAREARNFLNQVSLYKDLGVLLASAHKDLAALEKVQKDLHDLHRKNIRTSADMLETVSNHSPDNLLVNKQSFSVQEKFLSDHADLKHALVQFCQNLDLIPCYPQRDAEKVKTLQTQVERYLKLVVTVQSDIRSSVANLLDAKTNYANSKALLSKIAKLNTRVNPNLAASLAQVAEEIDSVDQAFKQPLSPLILKRQTAEVVAHSVQVLESITAAESEASQAYRKLEDARKVFESTHRWTNSRYRVQIDSRRAGNTLQSAEEAFKLGLFSQSLTHIQATQVACKEAVRIADAEVLSLRRIEEEREAQRRAQEERERQARESKRRADQAAEESRRSNQSSNDSYKSDHGSSSSSYNSDHGSSGDKW